MSDEKRATPAVPIEKLEEFERRIRAEGDEATEITSGVKEGDKIVTITASVASPTGASGGGFGGGRGGGRGFGGGLDG